MKKVLFATIAIIALSIISCGGNKAEASDNTDNEKGSGLVVRGGKSAKVTNCYWANNKKWIGVQGGSDRMVYAEFNFAAEFDSMTYTITTFANEHILEGGYIWGGVFIQDEGGESIIVQGTLELTVTDDYCKLKAIGKDDDGKAVTVTWEGPMMQDPSPY